MTLSDLYNSNKIINNMDYDDSIANAKDNDNNYVNNSESNQSDTLDAYFLKRTSFGTINYAKKQN